MHEIIMHSSTDWIFKHSITTLPYNDVVFLEPEVPSQNQALNCTLGKAPLRVRYGSCPTFIFGEYIQMHIFFLNNLSGHTFEN
jgi:hypothetical protein